MLNTEFNYQYRDGGNYKVYASPVFKGLLTDKQKEDIVGKLGDGEYFIPEQVGLESQQYQLTEKYGVDPDLDHNFHEVVDISDITDVDKEPTVKMTAEELYQKFMAVQVWDCGKGVLK